MSSWDFGPGLRRILRCCGRVEKRLMASRDAREFFGSQSGDEGAPSASSGQAATTAAEDGGAAWASVQVEVYFYGYLDSDGMTVFHGGFEFPVLHGFNGFFVQAHAETA